MSAMKKPIFHYPMDNEEWEDLIRQCLSNPINPMWEFEKAFAIMTRVADQFMGEGNYRFIVMNGEVGVENLNGDGAFPIKHLVIIKNPKRLGQLIDKLNLKLQEV